jgi:hypothetical protein
VARVVVGLVLHRRHVEIVPAGAMLPIPEHSRARGSSPQRSPAGQRSAGQWPDSAIQNARSISEKDALRGCRAASGAWPRAPSTPLRTLIEESLPTTTEIAPSKTCLAPTPRTANPLRDGQYGTANYRSRQFARRDPIRRNCCLRPVHLHGGPP